MKRLLSLLLAIAFCFALAAPSMAASSDVDDAMRAYAEIVAQAENYDFGYSEFQLDSKTFQYAVINLADAKGMPTLLLQMSVSSGMLGFMDSTRVFQYNPSSKTIMAPTNSLTSGVASSGGFRGGIGLCNGQLSTQSWQAMSGEGWIDLYSLINGELESTTIWSGKYDQVPDYLHMETISWKSIDDTADFEAFQVSTALPAAVAVSINGVTVQWTDAAPFIDVNNRTMVPLRAVAEALGLTVDWDGAKREAVFTNGTKTIFFPIDSSVARTGDGGTVQMDTAAVIVNDRTFAPIRYLAECFDYVVDWDGTTRTVLILARGNGFGGYYEKMMDPCGSLNASADLMITAINNPGQYAVVLQQANGFGKIDDAIGVERNGVLEITATYGSRTLYFNFYCIGDYYYLEGTNSNYFIGSSPEGPYLKDRGYLSENDAFLAAIGTKKEGIKMCEMGLLRTPIALYDYDQDGREELLILSYSIDNYSEYLNIFWLDNGEMHWKTDEKVNIGNIEQGQLTTIAEIFTQYGMTYEDAIDHFSIK